MKDLTSKFQQELIFYLTRQDIRKRSAIVKKHSINLHKNGDFSFPTNKCFWNSYVNTCENVPILLEEKEFDAERLIGYSKCCCFLINRCALKNDRIILFLNRVNTFRVGIMNLFDSDNILNEGIEFLNLFQENIDLTVLREKILENTLNNFITIFSRRHKDYQASNKFHIQCGPVLNIKSGTKEKTINSSKLLEDRHSELLLQARHKYGLRPSGDWSVLLNDIAKSVITFEFLLVKPSSPLKIDFRQGAASTRAGAFVEYNCARMEMLLNKFKNQVMNGYYEPLPCLDNVDFTLLNDESEWRLLFNYILQFPSILNEIYNAKEQNFSPHTLCAFISSMVRDFSVYYKRIVVLRENRAHLIPAMNARLYLVKAVSCILKLSMRLINMKCIKQM